MRILSFVILMGLILMTHHTHANDRVLDIREYTSPSGIIFWHVEDHSLPIRTLHFAFEGAGAIHDPNDKIGLGQLVSNTIDEGAGDRDANQFQEALQNHAIDLIFSNNRDHFTGKIKTLSRHSDLAFSLLRDSLHEPRFDLRDVERMKQANITRIKSSMARPDWLASRLMNDTFYGDHLYARNSGGTLSGLRSIADEDMHAFVSNKFTKNNVVIATAGDMTGQEAGIIIDEVFADLPEGQKLNNIDKVIPPKNAVKKAYRKDSPQSVVQMAWPSFDKEDVDYYALRVMNHLLGGGGFSSYLMDEVREKKGLTYGIYSAPHFMKYANLLTIESATEPDNIAEMTKTIESILDRMKTTKVDSQLLDDAKNYLIGSLPLRFSTTLSLSGAAMRMQLDGRGINALDEWRQNIEKVTAEDVMRVANRIFVDTKPTVTVIAGAVPDGQDFDIVETIEGIE